MYATAKDLNYDSPMYNPKKEHTTQRTFSPLIEIEKKNNNRIISSTPIPTHKEIQTQAPPPIEMSWKTDIVSTANPKIWGPAFWFTLHVSAAHYPQNPSQIVRDRMKDRILAIPYEIPCATCRPHAISYIELNREKLEVIVSSRDNLGKFYVDFHNHVNRRYGKPEWTYEKAFKYYSGEAKISYLS
jgi:hypothetical protein